MSRFDVVLLCAELCSIGIAFNVCVLMLRGAALC